MNKKTIFSLMLVLCCSNVFANDKVVAPTASSIDRTTLDRCIEENGGVEAFVEGQAVSKRVVENAVQCTYRDNMKSLGVNNDPPPVLECISKFFVKFALTTVSVLIDPKICNFNSACVQAHAKAIFSYACHQTACMPQIICNSKT